MLRRYSLMWIFALLALLTACRPAPPISEPGGAATSPAATQAPNTATPSPSPALPVISPTPLQEQAGPEARPTGADTVPPPPTPTLPPPTPPLLQWGLPDPATAQWVAVAQGFQQPTAITAAPNFPGRLFVLERQGVAWTLSPEGQRQIFLDLRDRVGSAQTEQGLLGIAFHPRFPEVPWVFLNYTDKNGDTVVSKFPVNVQTWTADPNRERVILQVEQPYGNHNGGHLLFGPDGYLYIGLGDGGAAGDPMDLAQNPQSLLGKMLRLDIDQEPYAIPPDNAFPEGGGRPEIWALGLRNPWRYDFDPYTGDLYIADVGQDAWEEVNFWPADGGPGANYGWDYYEGSHPYEDEPPPGVTFIFPVAEYPTRSGCAITGGVVYRGQALDPTWQGVYLFGDFCNGNIWGLRQQPDGSWVYEVLYDTPFLISTFGRDVAGFGLDAQGEVYLADYATGTIYRLEPVR